MKKMGDIMAEMGFRKDAPDSVKEAFIKHLIQASTGVMIETPSEKKEPKKIVPKNLIFDLRPGPAQEASTQLAFDFDQDQGPRQELPRPKQDLPKQKVS